jgi:hypothetical protein
VQRAASISKGRVPSVAANGMVWAVATAGGEGQTVAEQTQATLRTLEATLVGAGSSKHRFVHYTIHTTAAQAS